MKTCFQIIIAFIAMAGLTASCKKDDDKKAASGASVEYRITNGGGMVTAIQYTDASAATITDQSDPVATDWSKKITVSNKPFASSLKVTAQNTSAAAVTPMLYILVNDTVKAAQPLNVQPMGNAVQQVSFTVQ